MGFFEELHDTSIPLDEVLCKYRLNLESAMEIIPQPVVSKKESMVDMHNIYYINGYYRIRKMIKGEHTGFGVYYCSDDAGRVRDKLQEHEWDKSLLDDICSQLSIRRKEEYKPRKKKRMTYYTLWDNQKVRYYVNKNARRNFRVVYKSKPVGIGYFLEPFTCMLIHDLIMEALRV
jgi:hypothetical protein